MSLTTSFHWKYKAISTLSSIVLCVEIHLSRLRIHSRTGSKTAAVMLLKTKLFSSALNCSRHSPVLFNDTVLETQATIFARCCTIPCRIPAWSEIEKEYPSGARLDDASIFHKNSSEYILCCHKAHDSLEQSRPVEHIKLMTKFGSTERDNSNKTLDQVELWYVMWHKDDTEVFVLKKICGQ